MPACLACLACLRRGAAFGLSGVVKGLGIMAMKNYNIMEDLKAAVEVRARMRVCVRVCMHVCVHVGAGWMHAAACTVDALARVLVDICLCACARRQLAFFCPTTPILHMAL